MADTGDRSIGGIVGYLRLDKSDWDAELNAAGAKADELGRKNPKITVTTNARDALVQLEAVAAATNRVQDSQQKLSVAQQKLNDLTDKGGASAKQLSTAQNAVAKASRDTELAQIRLATAYATAEGAADKATASSNRLGGGGGRIGGSGLSGISGGAESAGSSISGVLLPALAALATVVGPVAAVGASAFGTLLLGASGLEKQVESGLTPAFHELQNTATDALGPGIAGALQQLEQGLPKLNPLVQFFGQEVGDAADQFATWLNDGALQKFTDYAERELPIVEGAFVSVSKAGISFFDAVTPAGNELLEVLTNIADSVTFIDGAFKGGPLGDGSGFSKSGFGGVSYSTLVPGLPLLKDLGHTIASNASFGHVSQAPTRIASSLRPAPSLNSQALNFAASSIATAPSLNSQALQQAAGGLDAGSSSILYNAHALGATVAAYQGAVTAAAQFKDQTAANTLAMQAENNAAGLLSQALQGLDGNNLGVAQSSTSFHVAVSSATAALKANGVTLNENTASGQANLQAIQSAVQAAQQHAAAVDQQTGSTQAGTAAYNADIATLEKQLGATGAAKGAIDAYIDSISKIPPVASTTIDVLFNELTSQLNGGAAVTSEAVARSKAAGYATGGVVTDGWFKTGELGPEWGYKSGPNVKIFNAQQSAAMDGPGSNRPSVVQNIYPAAAMDEYSLAVHVGRVLSSISV